MLTEINYTSLVSLDKEIHEDKSEIEKIILIKVPTDVYPSIYETFCFLFKQAGVKNINIDKEVDFEKMYNKRKK